MVNTKMEESTSIDIDFVTKKLSQTSHPYFGLTTSCIHRIDQRIRKMNEDAYTPDTITIGPYHRKAHKKNTQMQAMEDLKSRYLQQLLDRTSERTSIQKYVKALKEIEIKAREYYAEVISYDEDFIEIMLFDGVFLIELFRKDADVVKPDDNDPLLNSSLRRSRVVRDLLLLENQIPLLVLQTLFDLSKDPISDQLSLTELARLFFKNFIPEATHEYPEDKQTIKHNHLLDLLSCALEESLPPIKDKTSTASLEALPSVTELRNAGVNFVKSPDNDRFLDIKFQHGVFEIPQLLVDDYTDTFFRNIIAYEQHRYKGRDYMTSYAQLMDYLINSADDVAFLRSRGIIKNHLGDDSKVSNLINNLCNEISVIHFSYGDLCEKVHQYYNSPYNQWRETLRRDYCNSPWAIISVIAAIILLLLNFWLAVFAALPIFTAHA